MAGESVYLGLKVIFTMNNTETPPPFNVEELLVATESMLEPETKAWIDALIASRMKDKTAEYTTTSEFC